MWITIQDDKGLILEHFESNLSATAIKERLTKDRVSLVMSKMGRKGGQKGGLVTASRMSPEQRKDRAMKGVQAREAKRQEKRNASARYQTIATSSTLTPNKL